jgi:hypothetical protein
MKKIFITYGDSGYETAKAKICEEAKATGEFDEIISYGREDLSEDLLQSDIIKIKRGGGLWSWKPDVILQTMDNYHDGDAIVYCDAGCTLYPSKEWKEYWRKLENHDIIAQRIYQRTDNWTRKETLDYFKENGKNWALCYQYQATIIIIISEFTKRFVREWRNIMINHPELAMDVTEEEHSIQHKGFIENRHDQAVYSALIYKYLADTKTKNKIYTQWEHIEDYDPFKKQAIRATRMRQGQQEPLNLLIKRCVKRIIKDYILCPFVYSPRQMWYSK